MNYVDSVRYLYSLGNELKTGVKFDLERMRTLLAALGNPERGQRFVHVAGTNGKGSTCAMVANALRDAGRRVGLYTSPHLIEPTERIQIDGRPIAPYEFAETFETVHEAAEKLLETEKLDAHPSYFETVTAMAMLIFRERCEVSVLEVGLGGRLDATNVVIPDLCIITPISYDHEAFLGNSVPAIASEKAGILKPGVPVVLARQLPAAEAVILKRASDLGCKVMRATDVSAVDLDVTARGSSFFLDGIRYECGLRGAHQVENATAAILACRQLGLEVTAIQEGLRSVRWPGRLEVVSFKPEMILDGAHNPAGAAALADYIRMFYHSRVVWIVYAAMRDKAIEEVTGQLFPLAQRLILTMPDFSRALRPEAILAATNHPDATITHSVEEAIGVARTAPAEAAVFFAGSLFLVGEARAQLLAAGEIVS